ITNRQIRHFRPTLALIKGGKDPLSQGLRRRRKVFQRAFVGKLNTRNVEETVDVDRHRPMEDAPQNVEADFAPRQYLLKGIAKRKGMHRTEPVIDIIRLGETRQAPSRCQSKVSSNFNWRRARIQRPGDRTKDRARIFFQEFEVKVRSRVAALCSQAIAEILFGFSDQFNKIRWCSPRAAFLLGL